MEKKKFENPELRKGDIELSYIICKSANCSGSSSHKFYVRDSADIVSDSKAA